MTEQAETVASVSVIAAYREDHFRRAALRYMVRRVGWQYALVIFVCAPIWALALARRAPQDLLVAPISAWLVPLVAGMLFGIGYFCFQYRKCLRANLTVFRKLNPPQTAYTFTADTIAQTNSLASARVNWTALTYLDLWRYRDIWMLFINKNAWHILPTENLDEQAQRYIAEQVRAHGGKVR